MTKFIDYKDGYGAIRATMLVDEAGTMIGKAEYLNGETYRVCIKGREKFVEDGLELAREALTTGKSANERMFEMLEAAGRN